MLLLLQTYGLSCFRRGVGDGKIFQGDGSDSRTEKDTFSSRMNTERNLNSSKPPFGTRSTTPQPPPDSGGGVKDGENFQEGDSNFRKDKDKPSSRVNTERDLATSKPPPVLGGGEGGGRKGYKLTKLGWIPEEWDLLPVKEFLFSVNIQFLTNLLKYLDLSRLRNKGGQPLVSQKPIYELIIQLPSLEEQQKIASVLSSADLEISNLQNHLDKLKNQKKGLMQKLLTGEVRVKIENNIYNPKNVSLLKSNIIELAGVIDEFGKEMAKIKKPLNVVEQYYNSHLKRVRANLEGVIQLLDSYANCYIIIIPIAQIMRSLLTDFLTAYYMFTFYDRKDTDHTSFSNELKLFDRDACNAMVEWMESEEDLHKFNENLPPISEERIEERKKGFEFFFSEILDDNKKRKKPKDIRSSSNPKFFGGNKTLKNPSGIINEKYKIDRLKEMEYFKMPDGYMLYKYYSQFYHESKLSSHLAGKDTVNDNFKYLRWGLIPIYHMIDNSIRLFMTGENGFSKRLEELKLELEAIGND